MDAALRIALVLTAFDQASGVINQMTNRASARFDEMRKAARKMAEGFALIGAGNAGMNFLKGPIKDFAEVEKHAARLKSNLMDNSGILDPTQWEKVNVLARDLGNELPGTTSDFYKMFTVMKQLGVETQTILGGAGRASANLAIAIGESYETVAESAGRLQNATGVAASDLTAFFDTIARTKNMGVPLYDMEQAFARSAGQLKFLGIQGLESSKKMSAFFATFIRQGMGGQTVGTNFSRILSEVLNPKKYGEMQAAAHKYGVSLDLLDKRGNFAGIDNMIAQFDKLRGFSTDRISAILSPLTGAEGMDDQMVKALSKGREEFDKMVGGMNKQASLDKKVGTQLATLDAQWEALTGTWTNVKATFGAALKPTLDALLKFLNKVTVGLQNFVEQHPKLAQFVGTFIAVASAGLMLAGVIRIIQGIAIVMKVLNLTMMANPFILFASLAIAAVTLIITYWSEISAFFAGIWQSIKDTWNKFWGWVTGAMSKFNPKTLIYKAWVALPQMLVGIWNSAKKPFVDAYEYVVGLGSKFWNAGKNIVKNIWEGMKSMWNDMINWFSDGLKKMREYLPFSPAKRGPLRDIHRIKLMETIAASIKPMPVMNAMNNAMGQVASFGGGQQIQAKGGGGGIHFAPVINLYGTATQNDANMISDTLKKQVLNILKQEQSRQQRTGY